MKVIGVMRKNQLYDDLEKFDECKTLDEVDTLLRALVAKFGVDHYLIGYMPPKNASADQQVEHLIMGHWPTEWANRYFNSGYIEKDPTIEHVRRSVQPIDWSRIMLSTHGNNIVMNEARDFSLNSGLTISHVAVDGRRIGASFAGACPDIDHPEFRTFLTMVSASAIASTIHIENTAIKPSGSVHLTEREHEVLLLASHGNRILEIANKLSIHPGTVRKHLDTARSKLGALNKTHAVAEAMRRGILSSQWAQMPIL